MPAIRGENLDKKSREAQPRIVSGFFVDDSCIPTMDFLSPHVFKKGTRKKQNKNNKMDKVQIAPPRIPLDFSLLMTPAISIMDSRLPPASYRYYRLGLKGGTPKSKLRSVRTKNLLSKQTVEVQSNPVICNLIPKINSSQIPIHNFNQTSP